MLPKEIEDIIYKKKLSLCVHEINEDIKNLKRQEFIADDIYPKAHRFFPEHMVYIITTNPKYKIKSIYLNNISYRNIGCKQWTYICGKCGEYLKEADNEFHCECGNYFNPMY